MKTLYRIFFLLTLTSLILFIIIFIEDKQFKKSPLPREILYKLKEKDKDIRAIIQKKYGVSVYFPIRIANQLPNNLFGLTTYDKKGVIRILLNKKRFQEDKNYMIDYVLPHEYAHAMMFYFKDFTQKNGGHTKKWENICYNLSGRKCSRFVNHNDVLIEKLGGIY